MKQYISGNTLLMADWDYKENYTLDPQKLTIGSNKKASWVCAKCGHKWKTSIYHRAIRGTGCPHCYCSKRISVKNNLIVTHPDIADNWDRLKNRNLTPDMFTRGSRYKAYWKCKKCGNESYQSIHGYKGCSHCKKNEVLEKESLYKVKPQIAKEWHQAKNGNLTPKEVTSGSNKRAWWKCSKCGHEWNTKINNRGVLGRGCPCCANKVVVVGKNDLSTTHPKIAKEWHPTKNGNLMPTDVVCGFNKKIWWRCPQGHEYQATVNHRTTKHQGTDCPVCYSGRQTSFSEQAFYYYIKKLYPDTINRYQAEFLGKMELDIYIPSIKFAIEYDGEAWHKKEKLAREQKKYKICHSNGIKLIRFREKMSKLNSDIADESYSTPNMYKHKNLEKIIISFLKRLDFSGKGIGRINPFDVNIERDRFKILENYNTYKKDSFENTYPKIAKEWHPTKNSGLTPNMFKAGSSHKVWWICPKCSYEYQSTISHRTSEKSATACPKCGIEKSAQAKRKAVNMIDPKTGDVIATFNSITEASKKMKINSSNISMVCNGTRPKAGGYTWCYKDK